MIAVNVRSVVLDSATQQEFRLKRGFQGRTMRMKKRNCTYSSVFYFLHSVEMLKPSGNNFLGIFSVIGSDTRTLKKKLKKHIKMTLRYYDDEPKNSFRTDLSRMFFLEEDYPSPPGKNIFKLAVFSLFLNFKKIYS